MIWVTYEEGRKSPQKIVSNILMYQKKKLQKKKLKRKRNDHCMQMCNGGLRILILWKFVTSLKQKSPPLSYFSRGLSCINIRRPVSLLQGWWVRKIGEILFYSPSHMPTSSLIFLRTTLCLSFSLLLFFFSTYLIFSSAQTYSRSWKKINLLFLTNEFLIFNFFFFGRLFFFFQ